jgi:2-iminobutanoate/2-iminopropanoate deaminase
MQVPISHSIGKRMGMSEQWRRFRNQKTGCISEPYFFECVPLKEAGKKMRINKEAKSFGMSWEKEYGYSQAIKVDNTIYVSGQVSHDERGNIVGPGNMDVQMRQAYANIEKLLAQYGATIDNIVDEVLFVTDMDAAFAARAKCKQEVFSGNPLLASTIVQIQRLAFPELMVEIRCICKV